MSKPSIQWSGRSATALPDGWAVSNLKALGDLICGQSPSSSHVNRDGEGMLYVSGPEQWNGYTIDADKWTTAPKRIVPSGCIFITVKGAGVGTIFPGIKCAIGRDIYAYYPSANVSAKYIEFALINTVHKLIWNAQGDIPGLSKNHLLDHDICLPGLTEQERIVSKISSLFSMLDKGEEALLQVQKLIDRYRQSVLKAAVTGELTREWREKSRHNLETGEELLARILKARRKAWEKAELDKMRSRGKKLRGDKWKHNYKEPQGPDTSDLPDLPKRWVWTTLESIAWNSSYGTSDKCLYDGNGIGVLRIPNIRYGDIDERDIKYLHNALAVPQQEMVKRGDLLIIRTNGSKDIIGTGSVANKTVEDKYYYASYIIRFRLCLPKVISEWINIYWQSNPVRNFVLSIAATSAGQYNVSMTNLAKMPIPLPPGHEIQEILNQYYNLMNECEDCRQFIDNALANQGMIRKSILKAAFSGKLVPQDPNDEPAFELLKRIDAEKEARQATQPKRRGAPRGKTKAKAKPEAEASQQNLPYDQGHIIRVARKNAGLTQAALAKATGLNQVNISQIENNKRTVTPAQAEKLAKVLDIDTTAGGFNQ